MTNSVSVFNNADTVMFTSTASQSLLYIAIVITVVVFLQLITMKGENHGI